MTQKATGGTTKKVQGKGTIKVQSKTLMGPGTNPLRKSLNITEEALAIGKVPPEDVARLIA